MRKDLDLRAALVEYVKLAEVRARHEHVRASERATEWCLVGPLIALLGYDPADPDQCSVQHPIGSEEGTADFALLQEGRPVILVEVKRAGEPSLLSHRSQLAGYFKKAEVSLGILTDGLVWFFYTDLDKAGTMDAYPLLNWNMDYSQRYRESWLFSRSRKPEYSRRCVSDYITRGWLDRLSLGWVAQEMWSFHIQEKVLHAIEDISVYSCEDLAVEFLSLLQREAYDASTSKLRSFAKRLPAQRWNERTTRFWQAATMRVTPKTAEEDEDEE